MFQTILRSAFTLGILITLSTLAFAHGGSYGGPGGTGSTGGYATSGTGVPGPGPGPAGTGTGGDSGTTPGGTGSTGTPGTPGSPGSPNPGPGGSPVGPGTGGTGTTGGTTGGVKKAKSDANLSWAAWWFFNDDRFINLKAKIRTEVNDTTNPDIFGGSNSMSGDSVSYVNAKQIREDINPVLKFALKDPYFDTRAAAAIALGKTGMPNALEDLKSIMIDGHKVVRETSFLSMGILGNKEATPLLISVMTDSVEARKLLKQTNGIESRSRAFAALALGLIGSRESDQSDTETESALLSMIHDRNDSAHLDMKVAPIVALGLMKAGSSVPTLIKFLNDDSQHDWARAQAATALARIGDPSALDALVEALGDKKSAVRQSAALALGLIAKPEHAGISEKLQKLTHNSDTATKNFAIMSLAEIGGAENRDFLFRQTRRGNPGERSFAALGLGVYMYKNPTDALKSDIAKVLLAQFKAEKNPEIRGSNAVALGLMAETDAGKPILDILNDSGDSNLRAHLCTALGLMRYRPAIPDIRREVRFKGDLDLRRSAAIALGLMGDKDALDVLQKEMEASENSLGVHGAITQGLGFIGDRSAVKPLVKFLQERDKYQDSTRAFAAVALGLLGDKDDLPILSRISEFNNYMIRTDALREVLTIL